MAKIEVEKKGGAKWLWVLLALAALLLLAWLLFGGDDAELAEAEEAGTDVAAVETAASPEPLATEEDTETEVFVVEEDTASIETTAENVTEGELGPDEYDVEAETRIAAIKSQDFQPERAVTLSEVRVTDVVGDRTFLVSDGGEEELLVLLDEVPTPNDPTEGRYDVTEGQILDVTGTVREVQDGRIDGQRIEDMPAGTEVYLWADQADIEERP